MVRSWLRQLLDFRIKNNKQDHYAPYYDIFDDWPLIEASFSQQYGIRIRQENDMTWEEFCNHINGLLAESPLGQIVSIRAENDPERLKGFNADQKRIRSEWRMKCDRLAIANMTPAQKKDSVDKLQSMFKSMFS